MRTGFLLAIAAYASVLWAAGLRAPGRRAGFESFFLASRRLGPARVAFSLCASWIGAASLLVSALMRPGRGEGNQPPEGQ